MYLHGFSTYRWNMRRKRKRKEREPGLTSRKFWKCSSLLSRNTSITTLRTWWRSLSNLWWVTMFLSQPDSCGPTNMFKNNDYILGVRLQYSVSQCNILLFMLQLIQIKCNAGEIKLPPGHKFDRVMGLNPYIICERLHHRRDERERIICNVSSRWWAVYMHILYQ